MSPELDERLAALRTHDLPGIAAPAEIRAGAERRRRRTYAGLLGVVAAGTAVAVGILMTAAPSHHPPPGQPTPTASAAGPTLLYGRITQDGRPAAGAQIIVQLWPNSTVEASIKTGETVPTQILPPVTTAADGTYRVVLDPAAVPPMYWEGDSVNLAIDVFYDGLTGGWNDPTGRCAQGGAWCDGNDTTLQITFEMGGSPTVTEDGGDPQSWAVEPI